MAYRELKDKAVAAMRARLEPWRELRVSMDELLGAKLELRAARRELELEVERRRSIEARLRADEARREVFFENSPALIFVKDRAFRYTQVNRRFATLAGPADDALGKTDFDLFDAESARRLRANDEEVLRARAPLQTRESIAAQEGMRHFLSVKFPLFDGSGELEGLGGIATEITEMIAADEERQRMQAKLLEAQKLESLGVLAGGVAHDFNNLLTGILGNVTLALFELGPRHRAASLIEQIEVAALKASDLTRQLLAYAGKGKFVVEPLDLSRLVGEMATLLRTTVPKKVRLELDLGADLPVIDGDSSQLHQVVMNLVLNAAEAIGDAEGVVIVRTRVVSAPPEEIPTAGGSPLPKGPYVRLEVTDTGVGMDDATVARIFEPFFTTKFAGRGLGLPAILGIVGAHRGAVYVRSAPGGGSTFELYLPAGDEPIVRRSDEPRTVPQLERRFEGTILLVDDEHLSRTATASMLRKLGFRVLEAADGFCGVEAFRDHADEVRLVLLDLTMPRMGGEEVLAAIRALRGHVPVIVMSGFSREDVTRRFGSLPPSGVLEKPFGIDDLVLEMRQHLEAVMPADVG